MNPMTIQCARCATHLVLTAGLLERVSGRSGRVTCQGCGDKIGLDAQGESLILAGAERMPEPDLELDESPVHDVTRLSLVPPPPSAFEQRLSLHPAPRPPRPSLGARPSLPPTSPADPFDPLGSLAPVVPLQGVRLTEDGRLINGADEPLQAKSRLRRRTWAPILAAALLGTGFASAHVGSILPLRRPSPALKATAAASTSAERATFEQGPAVPVSSENSPARAPVASDLLRAGEPAAPRSVGARKNEARDLSDEASSSARATQVGAAVTGASTQAEATSQASEAPVAAEEPAAADASAGATEPTAADAAATDAGVEAAPGPEFSKDAATIALQHAAAEALSCRQPGDPAGSARVVVTFAPSGRVTSANITGAPYAGTLTGGCIAGRFRGATVPAFEGGFVTVSKTIALD